MSFQAIQYSAEYLLVRLFAAVFHVLGPRLGLPLARALGRLIYHLDGRHRRIALENIRLALGEALSEPERRRTICRAYQNLAMNMAELCFFHRAVRPETLENFIQFTNTQLLQEALAGGRGVLLVSGHLGNWELASCAVSMRITACHSVARALKNPKVDAWLNERRRQSGGHVIPKDGALRTLVRRLREGKLLVFLLDQHAGDKGIPATFFGRTAYTFDSVATLSRRFRVPVIFGFGRRVGGRFFHEVRFVERIDPGEASVAELTERYNRLLEEAVREIPDQWLWMHRRWKESSARAAVPPAWTPASAAPAGRELT